MKLNEDDLYRMSSQFRHWSFTPQKLAELRLKTNTQASERVKANVARQRAQRVLDAEAAAGTDENGGSGVETGNSTPLHVEREVDCLTAAEEMRLVDSFCENMLELGKFCEFPIEVTATGIQFLRRFYLYNSPMTYEGQNISRTAMFLANKTEHFHPSAESYAARFPKTTAEQVLAPEYLIVQALRFNFDVKHPFRALKGGHLELMEMARGNLSAQPGSQQSSAELSKALSQVPRKPNGPPTKMTLPETEKRITEAYSFSSHLLKTAALLTDAYFLYTPSQIWLSAHLLADEPLTHFYLTTKLPSASPTFTKILATLRACADLFVAHPSYTAPHLSAPEREEREKTNKVEMKALIKKLRQCRDPDKMDLVKLNQAQKRDAVREDGGLEERKAKRRKVEREKYEKEQEEFWGPELPKRGENGGGEGNGENVI